MNLNLKFLLKNLNSYINGENCFGIVGGKIIYDFDDNTLVFGIKIFDLLINSREDLNIFICDVRIINEICEHYITMINLLDLLLGIKLLTLDDYKKMSDNFNVLRNESENIRGVLMKNRVKNIININSYLCERLLDLKKKDIQMTKELINILCNKY